jgi:hypothetical protein
MYYKFTAALILMVLLIIPVSGYSSLYSVDLSDRTTTTPRFIYWVATPGSEGFHLSVRNIVYFENVTYIKYTTRGNWPNNISATYQTRIFSGATQLGNATWQVSWSSALSYSALGTITITIQDFNRKGLTGAQNLRFADTPKPSTYVWMHTLTNGWDTSGLTSQFAVTPYEASAGYKYNGTYELYGGLPVPPIVFSISDFSNFTKKLQGVNITISNGQSGITDVNGELSISPIPSGSGFTYDLVKTGYVSKFAQSLGGYGSTGGTLYDTMDLSTGALPAGYTRTVVRTIDALTGQTLIGTTINLRDVQNNSWVNSTADADGISIIDVVTGHTLDIYGSYPGVYTSTYELNAVAGSPPDYLLPLYPPVPAAATGFVNMFVNVKEAVSNLAINGANVDFRYPAGTTIHAITDWAGIAQVQVPNKTVIIIGTSASGFNSQSESVTTGDFADTVRTVRLSKSSGPGATATVTATVTDPATGLPITTVPTYQPYCNPTAADYDARACSQSKDNDLMAQLRDNGSVIMSLAILAIIFGLLKMIMKF